jgi:trehalose 6-phosphate synthase
VNPFAPEDIADAMRDALVMSPDERMRSMKLMRSAVETNNIYRWAGKILEHAMRIEAPRQQKTPMNFRVGAA